METKTDLIQWVLSKSMQDVYIPQTQHSFSTFKIGKYRIPLEQIKALALVKKACALTNAKRGIISDKKT